MPSSTLQAPHSHCAAAPITAYVINHHKTYFKHKKSKGNFCSIAEENSQGCCDLFKVSIPCAPFPVQQVKTEGSLNSMGIHTCLPLRAVSFHNTWTFNVAEVEALPGPGKLYKFRSDGWSLGRTLFLTKGQ